MNKYEEALKEFMTTETSRFTMNCLFYQDELVAATDGHVAGFCSRELVPDLPPVYGNPPNLKAVIPTTRGEGVTLPISVLVNQDADTAQSAYRREMAVYQEKECGDCSGTGICECSCGDEHDCKECDGDGYSTVEPKAPTDPVVSLNGRAFAYRPLSKVRRAAEKLGAAEVAFIDAGPNYASVFKFDEMTAIVMPARPQDHQKPIELLS